MRTINSSPAKIAQIIACSVFVIGWTFVLPVAFGQFSFEPRSPEENGLAGINGTDTSTPTNNTAVGSILNEPTFLLRGLVGSTLYDTGNQTSGGQTGQDYVLAGRWRMFVNETEVQRFVANITMARTDGSDSHKVYIENINSRSSLSKSGNGLISEIFISVQSDGNGTSPAGRITTAITVQVTGNVMQFKMNLAERTDQVGAHIFALGGKPVYGIIESEQVGPS